MAYDELPESAVVFVCGYDPLGLGLPVYRIEPAVRTCKMPTWVRDG